MSTFEWLVIILLVLILIQTFRTRQYTYVVANNIKILGEPILREMKKR